MTGSQRRPAGIVSALATAALLSMMLATTVVAGSPSVVHQVSAGGPDACSGIGAKPGCDGSYSLVASQYSDGSASGQYTDRFSRGGGIKGVIDCLVVVGNDAWISGWITSGRFGDQDLAGLAFTTRIRDNGTSAKDPPDQISSSHTGDETPCTDMAPWDLFDTPQGQVKVS